MSRRTGFTLAAGMAAALALVAGAVGAQQSEEVSFAPGNYGTMISGTIVGHEYHDYRLAARAGQELFVDLKVSETDGYGIAYLNILPPGSDDVAIYVGSMDDNSSETVPLPEDGSYTIRVYLMGNDRDAGATVSYNIDVSIQ